MAKKPQKKKVSFKNSKKNNLRLLVVVLVFGILGITTVQLTSASPFSEYMRRFRTRNFNTNYNSSSSSSNCSTSVTTGNSSVTGNSSSTTVNQSGSSRNTVHNSSTSYQNTGGNRAVGC